MSSEPPEIDPSRERRTARPWRRWVGGAIAILLLLVVGGVVAVETFAWVLPQDFQNPPGFWLGRGYRLAFFARVFQFHAAVGVLGAAFIVLLMRWWRSALLAMVCGLVLLTPFAREYVPKPKQAVAGPTLRVMGMNLYYMNHDADAIVRAIDDADPDVIALPEATGWSGREIIHRRLKDRYPYIFVPPSDGSAVIISRVPFRLGEPVHLESWPAHVPLLFDLGGRDLALYGVHLVSPGADRHVRRNRRQTLEIAELREKDPRPTVIVGDFNFTQLTPNYRFLRSVGYRSSHDLAGFGVGNTWGPKWSWMNVLPGVRIDHILLTPELTAVSHRVGLDSGSDHRPVVAAIGFAVR